jgi:hypothetical protein
MIVSIVERCDPRIVVGGWAITPKDLRILYQRSGNCCAFDMLEDLDSTREHD